MSSDDQENSPKTNIRTDGGPFVGSDVNTGEDFVGRDKYTIINNLSNEKGKKNEDTKSSTTKRGIIVISVLLVSLVAVVAADRLLQVFWHVTPPVNTTATDKPKLISSSEYITSSVSLSVTELSGIRTNLANVKVCNKEIACTSGEEVRKGILLEAKRLAADKLFSDSLMSSIITTGQSPTFKDQLLDFSIAFVQTRDEPRYSYPVNESCVEISAYSVAETSSMFKPMQLTKTHYCDNPPAQFSMLEAGDQVKIETVRQVLEDYEPRLKNTKAPFFSLLRKIHYSEDVFDSDTGKYCVTFTGYILPIEIAAFIDSHASMEDIYPVLH